jgi:hypothetical protein
MDPIKLYFIQRYTSSQWEKEYNRYKWELSLQGVVDRATESFGKPDDLTIFMNPEVIKQYRNLLGPGKIKIR